MTERPERCGCVCLGDTWQLGKTKSLEIVTTVPDDAIVSWRDGAQLYCLRERPVSVLSGDSMQGQILEATNGVWKIGEVYVKCSAIYDGSSEYEKIRWIRAHVPSIPVPEIIHAWTDVAIGHFMITKAVPGETVFDAFTKLSPTDLEAIADQVAAHMTTLARFTSPRMIKFGGGVFRNNLLTEWAPPAFTGPAAADGFPTPNQLPFTSATYPLYIKAVTGVDCPPLGDGFVLTHPDLIARNIVIAPRNPPGGPSPESGAADADSPPVVAAILDWETLAYEPRWYRASYVPIQYDGPRGLLEWDYALKRRFKAHGFPDYDEWVELFEAKRCKMQDDWLTDPANDSVWPDLRFFPPVRGMVGYRYDLDNEPDAKAYVAAVVAEQETETGKKVGPE